MSEAEVLLGARFHRAGDVDQEQKLARAQPPLQPAELDDLAIVAHRVSQGSPQVDDSAAARTPVSIAAPPRQAPTRLARKAPQGFPDSRGPETALR